MSAKIQLRLATMGDIEALKDVMNRAIAQLLRPYLDNEKIAASFEIMGLDTQLVHDGTYFVADLDDHIVGSGGWSKRATLFGGDHSSGRDAALLDPAIDATRVRAMYTHPDFTRRGIGKAILAACENAARADGFVRAELMATLAGQPLYAACGYTPLELVSTTTSRGVQIPLVRMGKALL